MKSAMWVAAATAVSVLAMPATAALRPSVAAVSKGDVKFAAFRGAEGMNLRALEGTKPTSGKGIDGKPKNGHPDDPSRPHPERVSP
jgi:hypothetical protein